MLIARRRDQSKYPQLWDGLAGAWYPGAGPSGNTLYDLSGQDNHGTLTNMDAATDWVVNRGQMALDFDGLNDIIIVPHRAGNSLDITSNQITLSGWVYRRTATNYPYTANKSSSGSAISYLLGANDNKLRFFIGAAALEVAHVVLNRWVFHAGTYDGGTMRIYIDGIEAASAANTGNIPTNSAPFRIGSLGWSGDSYDGFMNDVRIYNRALHADEIKLLSQRPGIAFEPKRRVVYSIPSSVKAWLFRRQSQIIGGGLG